MAVGMGFAYGAAAGILLSSFIHMDFLTMPLLIIGGLSGVAITSGVFGDLGLGNFF